MIVTSLTQSFLKTDLSKKITKHRASSQICLMKIPKMMSTYRPSKRWLKGLRILCSCLLEQTLASLCLHHSCCNTCGDWSTLCRWYHWQYWFDLTSLLKQQWSLKWFSNFADSTSTKLMPYMKRCSTSERQIKFMAVDLTQMEKKLQSLKKLNLIHLSSSSCLDQSS